MSKLNPVFYLLSSTLIFWSLCAGLSNYFAKPVHPKVQKEEVVSSAEVDELKTKLEKDPKNESLNLEMAFALVKKGFDSGDMQFVMQAVQVFREVLDINPNNQEALLGLASLCLQSGVLDKAVFYYQKYLELRPDDLQAKADYAMATFKLGDSEKGEVILSEVLKVDDKFFPAYAIGAIAFHQGGDTKKAESYLAKAKELAPSKEALASLDQFLSSKPDSPQDKILAYFSNHQIIGPKLADSKWVDEKNLELMMKDFPVEQMPEFAKAAFISKAQAEIAKNQPGVKVILKDIITGKELLVVN
jgi:tetratricopeptide (TPR) repeat protein